MVSWSTLAGHRGGRFRRTMLWQRGELATLLRWLERLPRDATRPRPRLSLDLAWASLLSGQVDAVAPLLQDAEHALDTLDTAEPPTERGPHASGRALRGEITAIRAELARRRGESAAAIDLARHALADLPADKRRVRGGTTVFLAGAYLLRGDAAAASGAYAEAVALCQTPDTITVALFASGQLVQVQALQGQLHQAAETYRRTLDLAASYGMAEAPAIGVAQVGLAEAWRAWNDLDGADDLVRGASPTVRTRTGWRKGRWMALSR